MKKILGLDLGTTSIGWAVVNEPENATEKTEIIKTGVRVIPLTPDEQTNFEKGASITTNADRTLKRGARRNLHRYKMRRDHLVKLLKEHGFVDADTPLAETGKESTHSTWRIRAKAATERIELEELARVFLAINRKRGYKSNRKAKDEGDGQAVDGMAVARELYNNNLTPGEFVLQRLKAGKKYIPDFYRSDLQAELERIWNKQHQYHGLLLNSDLRNEIAEKSGRATWAILKDPWGIVGIKRETKGHEKKIEDYQWRVDALTKEVGLEELAIVIQQINGSISSSSGLLGEISDRSKQLLIKDQTVGQYVYDILEKNPHYSTKNNTTFYRQDYLDEFERIWETQKKFHPELTLELKEKIRDTVIFHQRRLKSQKALISVCEFEGREEQVMDEHGNPAFTKDGKPKMRRVGPRGIPKSSPLFQEFRIRQNLNHLVITYQGSGSPAENGVQHAQEEEGKEWVLGDEYRERLFNVLTWTDKLTANQALKELGLKPSEWKLNMEKLEGNRTHLKYIRAFDKILEATGHDAVKLEKLDADKKLETMEELFDSLGVNTDILHFDATLQGKAFEQQPAYAFWHLLYSYEGDKSRTGNESLLKQLQNKFGFPPEWAQGLTGISFEDDHGSLSARAIKKILPHLAKGFTYDQACLEAGYNHSHSVTAEENEQRELKDRLDILPKGHLRNPVVEKVLNQMIHVVNRVIETHGRPDEIRVEMARELKNSAEERKRMTEGINKATRQYEELRKEIATLYPFNTGVRITRNDLIKYRLWLELHANSYRTLYSDVKIPKEKIFSKDFDIEHIIPKARLFDDSFSNKTLELQEVNIKKGNTTAMDFVEAEYGEERAAQYRARVEHLFKKDARAKFRKLLWREEDIPDGFVERDLRNTQYITRTATAMLRQVARTVTTTTGRVTDVLRQDWQLINVLQNLNWPKYEKAGLTHTETNKEGQSIHRITDWTKRNDHRHHAMDALTVALTRPSHIQYLNYLNARKDESHKKHGNIIAIERKETEIDDKGRRRFKPPLPIDELRREFKKHLEATLVSFKAKNKVTTRNMNKSRRKGGFNRKVELTPRGQLHKETVYGQRKQYATKLVKVGPSFTEEMIAMVAKKSHRQALLLRLHSFGGDPKKAFGGKNALSKSPIWLDASHRYKLPEKVKLVDWQSGFTIRKPVGPDLMVDKVVDAGIRKLLKQRLARFGNNPKKAFINLEADPIWINEEHGIQLKRVTITGVSNAVPLHNKRDHHGKPILDAEGQTIVTDYVQTGNNHHVAIYRDAEGNLQESVVSFFEAVARRLQKLPIVDKQYNAEIGWTFLFTMKQNEMFVFPNEEAGFDPSALDLKDPANATLISPHLFRVQKIATKNYFFRHHLESQLIDTSQLRGITYSNPRTPNSLTGIQKVRMDHLGRIVHVGEY